jgi:hypothetical protein
LRRRDGIRVWRDKSVPRGTDSDICHKGTKIVPTLFNNPILSKKCFDYLPDYKDIQRTAKINVPKETKIGCRSSLASQRIQKCARIRVNECEYTKNWKNVFADVCIFYF